MNSRVNFSVWAPAFGHDLRAALPTIRQAGFGGVQLDSSSAMLDLAGLSSSGRREVRHLIASQDLQLTSIRVDLGTAGLGVGNDVDKGLDRVDRLLNAAVELGGPVVCLELGRLPPVQRVAKPKPKVTQEMAGLLILPPSPESQPAEPEETPVPTRIDPAVVSHWQQAMGQLGEIADRYGAVAALGSTLSSFAGLSGLLKSIDCPWFGVDLDPSHLLRDAWTLDELFDDVGPLVRHLRARDAVAGEDRRTKPAIIGRGDVPWRDLLAHLDDAGFSGAITIDPSELMDPRAGALAGLKQLLAVVGS
jgi:sugar phosphate isomerase/epimerase